MDREDRRGKTNKQFDFQFVVNYHRWSLFLICSYHSNLSNYIVIQYASPTPKGSAREGKDIRELDSLTLPVADLVAQPKGKGS